MDWDDLRIFIAVARSGQIARAASLLGMDATTVSRRLRRLEKALGEVLFERHRDGQRLTETGTRMAEAAETIDQSFQLLASRAETAAAPSGLVRVSTSEGFGTWFMALHLAKFDALYPSIRLDLVANSGFLDPSRRETDVAVLLARPRKGPLVTRKLTDYALRLYASHSYIAEKGPVSNALDLQRHRLIGYIPDLLYAPELNYLNEVAEGLEPHLRSSSINAQHRLAASGAGVAILPCFIGDLDPNLLRLLPSVRIKRSFWLATHKDTLGLRRMRCFVDWLVDITGSNRALLSGD